MSPEIKIALMVLTGLITGVFSGLFGVGGGIIIVPILVLLFQFSQTTATGTSLVALLLPVGFLGVREYYQSGRLAPADIKAGLWIALGLFFGAYFGAKLAVTLPEQAMRKAFALLLVFVSARLWWA